MNASEFEKLTNKTFATNIRQLGWKGSAFHFYQIDPNHIVNIQVLVFLYNQRLDFAGQPAASEAGHIANTSVASNGRMPTKIEQIIKLLFDKMRMTYEIWI